MSAPATNGAMMRTGGFPRFASGTNGTVLVSHSELLFTMVGTTGYTSETWPVTPYVLPWLSGVARNFSRFRWRNVRFEFVTSSPTSQGGSVAMGVTYDRAELNPSSLAEVAAMAHSFVGPVWTQPGQTLHSCALDPTRWSKPWYTFGFTGTTADEQDYTPAWITFAKQTQVNGQPIGQVLVTYDIEMVDPIPSRLQPVGVTDARPTMVRINGELNPPIEPTDTEVMLAILAASQGEAADARANARLETIRDSVVERLRELRTSDPPPPDPASESTSGDESEDDSDETAHPPRSSSLAS